MRPLDRLQIAWRAAQDIGDGKVVNLGIGMPVACGDYLPMGREVVLQSENGVVGVGPLAAAEMVDPDLVDAGSRRITLAPGGSIIESSASFAMIRGGHVDVTVLGAFEVAENGDLANWDMRLRDKGPLVGGAMDLAAGARETWVIMEHCTRKGAPRLLRRCTLPLTAPRCVTRIYTDLAVLAVDREGFLVLEVIDGLSREALAAKTGAELRFAERCAVLTAPSLGGA